MNFFLRLFFLTTVLFGVSDGFAASVTLTWTAPGNDGWIGTATKYDIRYALVPITDANWALATPVPNPPAPLPARNRQSLRLDNLLPATTYYIALKAADAKPNWSPLSNNAKKTTCPGVCIGISGNVDGSPDGLVNISDLSALTAYLTAPGGMTFSICPELANTDGSLDGVVNLSDLTRLVSYLTVGTPLASCLH